MPLVFARLASAALESAACFREVASASIARELPTREKKNLTGSSSCFSRLFVH